MKALNKKLNWREFRAEVPKARKKNTRVVIDRLGNKLQFKESWGILSL